MASALGRLCTIRVLISFNGLRRGESYTLPLTTRLQGLAQAGLIDIVQTIRPVPVYELDLDDDDEDAG